MSAAFLALSWMAISLLFLLPECQAPVVRDQGRVRAAESGDASTVERPPIAPPVGPPPGPEDVPGPACAPGAVAAWGWARRLRRRVRA